MNMIKEYINSLDTKRVFYYSFFYTIVIGITLQKIIIPLIFTEQHSTAGLIEGDWIFYLQRAKQEYYEIITIGWSEWELKPSGFGIIGVLSGVFAITGTTDPSIFLPISSFFIAIGASSLFKIFRLLNISKALSLLGVLPFLVLPTSFLFFSQITKDVFLISLSLLTTLILLKISSNSIKDDVKFFSRRYLWHLVVLSFVMFVCWIIRPYFGLYSLIYLVIFFLVLNVRNVIIFSKYKVNFLNLIISIALQSIFVFATLEGIYDQKDTTVNFIQIPHSIENEKMPHSIENEKMPHLIENENLHKKRYEFKTKNTFAPSDEDYLIDFKNAQKNIKVKEKASREFIWQDSDYLPTFINRNLKSISEHRNFFSSLHESSRTIIDMDISFKNLSDFLIYLPRAIQIALFTPFPDKWFGFPDSPYSALYSITVLQTIVCYILYLGLFPFIKERLKEFSTWIVLSYTIYVILMPVYLFPNIGTLIRYRQGSVSLLVGIGLIGLFIFFAKKRRENL